MSTVQVTWFPIVDNTAASQLIAESEHPFKVTVDYGNSADGVQQVPSEHDGLVNFVAMDVPTTATVEVTR
jgi:hypothetical protein